MGTLVKRRLNVTMKMAETGLFGGYIREYFDARSSRRLKQAENPLVAAFEFVRDMPYNYPASRNPIDVLSVRRGSCSGKHALLLQLYRELGIEARLMFVQHRLDAMPLQCPLPPSLQALRQAGGLPDIHNFVRLCINSHVVDVDATLDTALSGHGFPVAAGPFLTEPKEVGLDFEKEKEALVASLGPQGAERRRQFLTLYAQWLRELRASPERFEHLYTVSSQMVFAREDPAAGQVVRHGPFLHGAM